MNSVGEYDRGYREGYKQAYSEIGDLVRALIAVKTPKQKKPTFTIRSQTYGLLKRIKIDILTIKKGDVLCFYNKIRDKLNFYQYLGGSTFSVYSLEENINLTKLVDIEITAIVSYVSSSNKGKGILKIVNCPDNISSYIKEQIHDKELLEEPNFI